MTINQLPFGGERKEPFGGERGGFGGPFRGAFEERPCERRGVFGEERPFRDERRDLFRERPFRDEIRDRDERHSRDVFEIERQAREFNNEIIRL